MDLIVVGGGAGASSTYTTVLPLSMFRVKRYKYLHTDHLALHHNDNDRIVKLGCAYRNQARRNGQSDHQDDWWTYKMCSTEVPWLHCGGNSHCLAGSPESGVLVGRL